MQKIKVINNKKWLKDKFAAEPKTAGDKREWLIEIIKKLSNDILYLEKRIEYLENKREKKSGKII